MATSPHPPDGRGGLALGGFRDVPFVCIPSLFAAASLPTVTLGAYRGRLPPIYGQRAKPLDPLEIDRRTEDELRGAIERGRAAAVASGVARADYYEAVVLGRKR